MSKPSGSIDPLSYEERYIDPDAAWDLDIGDEHAGSQGATTPVPSKQVTTARIGAEAALRGRALQDLQDYTSNYVDSSLEHSHVNSPASDSNIMQVASTSKRRPSADTDGMISPFFSSASLLTGCLFSPSYTETKEVRSNGGPS